MFYAYFYCISLATIFILLISLWLGWLGIISHLGQVVQSWVKITRVSARFEFRFENFKSISAWILFVYELMIGSSKNNRENYPRKCFWRKVKETRGLNPNRPSNNWALVLNKINLGLFFFCSKAFSRIIFSVIFRSACRQKELKLQCFVSFQIWIQLSH